MVRTAFNRARHAGLVHGANPATDTKPRKVPKRAPAFLEPHEVTRLLDELGAGDRALVATALYAGLRKGELFGLRKTAIRRSRSRPMHISSLATCTRRSTGLLH